MGVVWSNEGIGIEEAGRPRASTDGRFRGVMVLDGTSRPRWLFIIVIRHRGPRLVTADQCRWACVLLCLLCLLLPCNPLTLYLRCQLQYPLLCPVSPDHLVFGNHLPVTRNDCALCLTCCCQPAFFLLCEDGCISVPGVLCLLQLASEVGPLEDCLSSQTKGACHTISFRLEAYRPDQVGEGEKEF